VRPHSDDGVLAPVGPLLLCSLTVGRHRRPQRPDHLRASPAPKRSLHGGKLRHLPCQLRGDLPRVCDGVQAHQRPVPRCARAAGGGSMLGRQGGWVMESAKAGGHGRAFDDTLRLESSNPLAPTNTHAPLSQWSHRWTPHPTTATGPSSTAPPASEWLGGPPSSLRRGGMRRAGWPPGKGAGAGRAPSLPLSRRPALSSHSRSAGINFTAGPPPRWAAPAARGRRAGRWAPASRNRATAHCESRLAVAPRR
jgi:hypothetical protein